MIGTILIGIGLPVSATCGLVASYGRCDKGERIAFRFWSLVGLAIMVLGVFLLDAESANQLLPYSKEVEQAFYSFTQKF